MSFAAAPDRRFRIAAVLAALVACALLLLGPAAAHAHDDLLGSTPENGAVLDAPPTEVELRFTAEPLAEPGGTIVRVLDPGGTPVQTGEPETADNGVFQAIEADPSVTGTYTVIWRVVSSDGHAISGELLFSVGEESEPAEQPTGPADSAADEGFDQSALWIVIGIVALALAATLVVVAISASRRRNGGV